ncbi:MAG: hypothetical protein QM796_20295 [Chthoniobacteraceae bacterium]
MSESIAGLISDSPLDRPLAVAYAGRLARALTSIALAGVAFALTAGVLHQAVPQPVLPVVTPKLAYFLQHKDEFDAVFIGSSRICHGIVPAAFDETMRQHGVASHSFNLGVEEMFPPATFQVLDTVLRSRPAHLKWVFLEEAPIYLTDNEPTLRSIAWHDAPATALVAKVLVGKNGLRGVYKHSTDLFANVRICLLNLTNIGRVPAVLRPQPDETQGATEYAGYMPLQGTHFENAAKAQKFQTDLATMYAKTPVPATEEPVSAEAFVKELQKIKAAGAQPCLVIPPMPQRGGDFLGSKAGCPVLAFNDAVRYAQFFDLSNRFDGGHLNDTGAHAFSQVLAEVFAGKQLVGGK